MTDSLVFSLQALLVRHEAYIAEAEESRRHLSLRVDALELDKRNLEAENARTAQENRDLLEHLDQLNTTVAESQGHVNSLEATLQSTQRELKRLEALASRTHDLEAQLVELEKEQEHLIETVVSTEAEERSAFRRWKEAERRLGQVHDQLERIEREASQERDRHDEVMRRMDRQKLVDKELRAKSSGRATVSAGGHGKNGTNVVSHFVKDILQDNVNLQMGIVELRDMLMTSNDEVQKLREQLMVHQPLQNGGSDEDTAPSTLKEELAVKEPVVTSQELHVHHHYHAPAKKEEIRRPVPKKKRNVSVNQNTPPRINSRGYRTRQSQSSVAATILSQTSTTVPSPRTPNRWSMQSASVASDFASSAPSSPQSNFRNSFLFDRMSMDQSMDFSRPTSPGSSVDPLSPVFKPKHHKRPSEFSTHSLNGQPIFQTGTIREEEDSDVEHLLDLETPSNNEPASLDDCNIVISVDSAEDPAMFDPFAADDYQPKLRRSNSHESILSISGIDIHTLKSRPSQLALSGSRALIWPRTRQGLSSPSTSFLSTGPILSSVELSAPTLSRQNYDSSSLLRSTMGIPERPASRSSTASGDTATKKPGGWIWSRWGVSPSPSTTTSPTASISGVPPPDLKRLPTQRAASTPIGKDPNKDPLRMMMGRSPGINQRGPIPGLRKADKAPSQVTPETVDWEALREVLEE